MADLHPTRRNMAQMLATVQSPQFKAQLAAFGAAVQTGQLDLKHSFGLDAKVGGTCAWCSR